MFDIMASLCQALEQERIDLYLLNKLIGITNSQKYFASLVLGSHPLRWWIQAQNADHEQETSASCRSIPTQKDSLEDFQLRRKIGLHLGEYK
jgi:hypothetical protein